MVPFGRWLTTDATAIRHGHPDRDELMDPHALQAGIFWAFFHGNHFITFYVRRLFPSYNILRHCKVAKLFRESCMTLIQRPR